MTRNLPCKEGYVLRHATPADPVCVTDEEHRQVEEENKLATERRGSNVCQPGYVWREASPSDYVCVEPSAREQAFFDNTAHNAQLRVRSMNCLRYAEKAVAQYHEMRALGCGFTGNRWSAESGGHNSWCSGVSKVDRDGETETRHRMLARCRERASRPLTPVPPGEVCAISIVVEAMSCLSTDGTPSSIGPGSTSTGCGGTEENARARARAGFESQFGRIDEDEPGPNGCTVTEDVVAGCFCS